MFVMVDSADWENFADAVVVGECGDSIRASFEGKLSTDEPSYSRDDWTTAVRAHNSCVLIVR